MSSTGAGYDYSCGTFSPDGRIFQIEYAMKAVENSGTAVGLKCKDGIVIAVGKAQVSKMLVPGSNRRVFGVDAHVGMAVTGYAADGRQLVNRGREEAQNYKETYGSAIVPSILMNRLSGFVHYFTIYGSLRPFGAAVIMSAFDEDLQTPELYMVEPSGVSFKYFGCAAGKGQNAAKTELEKIQNKHGNSGLTCRQAVDELARILQLIRDKEKPIEIEMGWLCEETNFKHALVPSAMLKEASEKALAALEGSSTDEGIAASLESSEAAQQMQIET